MTWLEKYMYIAYASVEGTRKFFLDMLIGRWTADIYQISKEKKYKYSTFDNLRQFYPIIKYF